MYKTSFIGCLLIALLLLGVDLLIFWGVQELWNWLAPVFWAGAPILTYWQAAGVVILLEILGSFFKSSK